MASLMSPVALRRDGTRASHHHTNMASSTTTCLKRSEPMSSPTSARYSACTQVAYNLDDALPADSAAKFRGAAHDEPSVPTLLLRDKPHECEQLPCPDCGKGMPNQPANRVARISQTSCDFMVTLFM